MRQKATLVILMVKTLYTTLQPGIRLALRAGFSTWICISIQRTGSFSSFVGFGHFGASKGLISGWISGFKSKQLKTTLSFFSFMNECIYSKHIPIIGIPERLQPCVSSCPSFPYLNSTTKPHHKSTNLSESFRIHTKRHERGKITGFIAQNWKL